MSAAPDHASVVRALAAGCIRTCARTISAVERGDAGLVPLLQALYRAGGRSRVIGVTGPPGAGKSSLVNQLIRLWRGRGLRLAVLAVDPSSPFTGGAVLGDRLRMSEHSCDEGVYMRSMAARGQLGGLARAAGDALTVLDAMPWDYVIVETVGVGQNETDVMQHADVVVLLHTPMGGDDVQAAKAGINEIADIYAVNKSDHPEADRTARHLAEMLSLGRQSRSDGDWFPPVVKTQALAAAGIDELADQIERRLAHLAAHPEVARRRAQARVRHRTAEILRHMLDQRLKSGDDGAGDALIDAVLRREHDPYALAAELLGDADDLRPRGAE